MQKKTHLLNYEGDGFFLKNLTKRQPSPTPCVDAITNSKYFACSNSLLLEYPLLVQKGQVHKPYKVGNTIENPNHIINVSGIPTLRKSENLYPPALNISKFV